MKKDTNGQINTKYGHVYPKEEMKDLDNHAKSLELTELPPFNRETLIHLSKSHPIIQSSNKEISMNIRYQDSSANSEPLGLLAFGMTTFLLNMHISGVYKLSPTILAMGLCYGGMAQLLAGIFEWIKGHTFSAIAFISYGTFWWSFVMIYAIPSFGWAEAIDDLSLAFYLFIWGIFTLIMLIAAVKKPIAIILIFATLTILFLLQAAGRWSHNEGVIIAGGAIGILCSLTSFYAGSAELINEAYNKTILPLGYSIKKE